TVRPVACGRTAAIAGPSFSTSAVVPGTEATMTGAPELRSNDASFPGLSSGASALPSDEAMPAPSTTGTSWSPCALKVRFFAMTCGLTDTDKEPTESSTGAATAGFAIVSIACCTAAAEIAGSTGAVGSFTGSDDVRKAARKAAIAL